LNEERPSRTAWLVRAAVASLTLVAYAPALQSPFQFDDRGTILRDPSVHGLGASLSSLGESLRPVLKASYGLCWALGGGGPAVFHAFNLLTHLVNVELVMRLVTASARTRARGIGSSLDPTALIAGVLFAVHPLQTEAVTYVTGRSASLSASFMLGALLFHAAGVRTGRRLFTLFFAPVAFLAALASKETSAIFPLVLCAWEAVVERSSLRVLVRRLWPWLGVSLVAAYALVMHPRTYALLYAALGRRSFSESLRYGVGGVAYLFARLALVARPCIDPGLWLKPPPDGIVVATGLLLSVVLVASARCRRERPLVLFGVLVFLLQAFALHVLLPRVDVVNERQAYFADAGAFLAVGALAAPLTTRWRARRWFVPFAAACVLLLAGLTLSRNLEYVSEVRLWEATVRDAPDNPRAQNNLGVAYELAGRPVEARIAYTRALILEPRYASARANLARVARADANGLRAPGAPKAGVERPGPAP
jgi:hypothetical protein